MVKLDGNLMKKGLGPMVGAPTIGGRWSTPSSVMFAAWMAWSETCGKREMVVCVCVNLQGEP